MMAYFIFVYGGSYLFIYWYDFDIVVMFYFEFIVVDSYLDLGVLFFEFLGDDIEFLGYCVRGVFLIL